MVIARVAASVVTLGGRIAPSQFNLLNLFSHSVNPFFPFFEKFFSFFLLFSGIRADMRVMEKLNPALPVRKQETSADADGYSERRAAMASKLTERMRALCSERALENEIVVIPKSHDCGFGEYLDTKLRTVYGSLRTRKRIGECHIELKYPNPDAAQYDFQVFKEAPGFRAKDGIFCGLLTVDITPYISAFNAYGLTDLISFAQDQLSNTTVMLVAETDTPGKASGLIAKARKHGFVETVFPMPTKEQVFAYARDVIGKPEKLDRRRIEILNAIEGCGFEAVEDIEKAVSSMARMPRMIKDPDTGKRFGY